MNIADLRRRYPGYSDDEIVGALQATKYPDFSVQEIKDVLGVKAPKRSLFAVANDTVIEAANAAAGTVGAISDFVVPGNRVSKFIDESIIKPGEASQSDAVKADKERFRSRMEAADGIGDELGAVGSYLADAPLQALAQAAGSFVVPGGAIKGTQALAKVAGAGAAGVTRAGLAGGVAVGAAGAGGDAAGTAYDLATKAGATDEQATDAARGASVIPAIVGGLGGLVGAERLLAGAGGFKGSLLSRALKTGAAEGVQEGVEEGVTQYEGQRAAVPFDPTINPAKGVAGASAMGAALGFATGAGTALLVRQEQADAGMADLRAAQTADDAIDAALRATDVPLEVPPAIDRFGEILPPGAGPRAVNERAIDEIRQLDPEQQNAALGLLATIDNPRVSPGVRRFAQNELDAMLLPVRQIPVGETEDLTPTIPAGETQELSSSEAAGQYLQPPTLQQRTAMGKRVPVGDATEIQPELVDLETIPQPDVIEVGGDAPRPEGMAERTRAPAAPVPAAPMTDDMLVKAVVDGFRGTNTPQARAFVQDFEAGRIKPADVLKLVGRPPQGPDERLAAAAAQAPQKAELQPGDLLTSDGMPYGTRSGAYARQKKDGGSLIEVPGGWAVRPKAEPETAPASARVPEAAAPQQVNAGAPEPSQSGSVSPSGDAVATKQPEAPAPIEADPQDRQGLRESDRRARDIDAAAAELTGQIVNDLKSDDDGKADFDAAEVLPGLRLFAEQANVPAEDLRQAVLKRLARENYITKGQLALVERALDPTQGTLAERVDKMRKGKPANPAEAPAPKPLSSADVGRAFDLMVQRERDTLEGVLFNWNEAELSPDADKIVMRPGRDGKYSKGSEGGKAGGRKGEFIAWLRSDAPFAPAVYGKDIGNDAEWRRQVEALRALVAAPAPAANQVAVKQQPVVTPAVSTAPAPAAANASSTPAAPNPERPEALIELRKRLSVLEALRRCIG